MEGSRHQARHEADDYRRVEVITGRRRRRNWTPAEKAAIVTASAMPGACVSDVARRFGVSRGVLTVWRREAGITGPGDTAGPWGGFIPVMTELPTPTVADRAPDVPVDRARPGGVIEVTVGQDRLVLTGEVDPTVVAAVIAALRG